MEKELIFKENGYQCHASTLVALSGGRFLAAWFAGPKEGDAGVGIRMSICDEKGWRLPVTIAKIKP